MTYEHFPYALYKMVFKDGTWQPATKDGLLCDGITYAETVTEGIALDEPDPYDVYGVWPMTKEDHRLDRGEEKIRTTKPDFLVTPHSSGCNFVLEDTRYTQNSSAHFGPSPARYAAVPLERIDAFYVPEMAFGVCLASTELAAAQAAQGGADTPGTGFGVWRIAPSRSASSCVYHHRPDALYVAQPDGSLEKRSQKVIDEMVRLLEEVKTNGT